MQVPPLLKFIFVLWIIKVTYTHGEKTQDTEVYTIGDESVLPSAPICLSHLAQMALLFLLAAYSQVSVSAEVFNQPSLWDS